MKYVKMLGLVAMVTALMGLIGVGTASATEVYRHTTGATLGAGTALDFSLESGTSANLTNTKGESLDTCNSSTVKGEITSAGSATTTTTGVNTYQEGGETKTGITWGGCTFATKTTVPGKLEIHNIKGTENGTLTADSEIGVTINTVFFGSCVYGVTAGTDLGTLTGAKTNGAELVPATFHANAVAEKLSGSNFACPETSLWKASYVATSPADLVVKES